MAAIRAQQKLIEFTENTRLYHHQIRLEDKRAVGFAQSMWIKGSTGTDAWMLQAVKMSPIAAAIDKAIKWIDGHVDVAIDGKVQQDERLIRLFVIPQYHIYAFWLESRDSDEILVVHMPRTRPILKYRHLYGWHEFLDALSKEKPVGFVMPHAAKTGAPPPLPPSAKSKRGSTRLARKT